jgi:hypothetical protein
MTNPLIHALVLAAAILIPGGLLAYFAWHTYMRRREDKQSEDDYPTPEEARAAFMKMYPPESLRARNRRNRLDRIPAYRWRNPQ